MFLFKHISVLLKWTTYLSPVFPPHSQDWKSTHLLPSSMVPPGREQPSVSPQDLLMASSWNRAGWRHCSSAARQCVLLHPPCTRTFCHRQGVLWECLYPGAAVWGWLCPCPPLHASSAGISGVRPRSKPHLEIFSMGNHHFLLLQDKICPQCGTQLFLWDCLYFL